MIVSEDENAKRALAVEGALAVLTGALISSDALDADTALIILNILSSSSEFSKTQHAPVIETLEKLRSLQQKPV